MALGFVVVHEFIKIIILSLNSYQWELSNNQSVFEGFSENFELVGGIKNFTINKVEVFKVEYI